MSGALLTASLALVFAVFAIAGFVLADARARRRVDENHALQIEALRAQAVRVGLDVRV